ncbi:MAG: nicotinate-nucleotide adenylyltransferase [Planctomycetota bacterium]
MKIGILGGTFNPIHAGHLIIAQAVYEKFKLDQILFIPCHTPYHKQNTYSPRCYIGGQVAEPKHRLKMVELATNNIAHFGVSDIDIKKGGLTYSLETLRRLKQNYPASAKFHFIIGADSLPELPLWYKIKELSRLCEFITVARPVLRLRRIIGTPRNGCHCESRLAGRSNLVSLRELKTISQKLGAGFARKIERNFLKHPIINISSTEIRARLKKRQSIKYLVPPSVEKYIINHKLYP